MIKTSIDLFRSGLGYNQISCVFNVLKSYTDIKSPHYTTIRQWVMRNSYSKLYSPLPDSTWVVLGDLTIDIGKIKSLVTVAVDVEKLKERENYILSLKDLEIIGINPTQKSTGVFACEAFREAFHRLGGPASIAAYIIDGGSDLQNGAKLLNQAIEKLYSVNSSDLVAQQKGPENSEKIIGVKELPNKKVPFLYDLSHKLSRVLEKELTADPNWEEYTKHLTNSRKLMAQTEFAALMPPKLRSKARFMNAALYIDWPEKILHIKQAGNLDSIPPDRYEKYFGWLPIFLPSLDNWIPKVSAVEMIKGIVRQYGLSQDSYEYLKYTFSLMPLENEILNFTNKALDSVYEEVKKLDVDQTLPAFTESLESTFGAHKNHVGRSGQGLCGNVITIATLVGSSPTVDEIHNAMEATSVKKIRSWAKEKIGETVGSLRRKYFKIKSDITSCNADNFKETKFDEQAFAMATG